MDITQLIGTNPKYPPIVDLSWLTPTDYDNYPSDNQPLRILPKLHDIWMKDIVEGKDDNEMEEAVKKLYESPKIIDLGKVEKTRDIIKDIKKLLMSGLSADKIISYIKMNYSKDEVLKVKNELKDILKEYGLLGNVYVDLSAFSDLKDAERFLKYNTRLAKYLLISNDMKLNEAQAKYLAYKFHKNVVSSIDYDEKLLKKYSLYLIDKKLIPSDFVIDSKEKLKNAFLGKYKDLLKQAEKNEESEKENNNDDDLNNIKEIDISPETDFSNQELEYCTVRPIIKFVCYLLSKNLSKDNIKTCLYNKFAKDDLKKAAKFIIFILKDKDFMDNMVKENKLSPKIAKEIADIKAKYPIININKNSKRAPNISRVIVTNPTLKQSMDSKYDEEIVNMLRNGRDLSEIKNFAISKYNKDADKILLASMNKFNNQGLIFNSSKDISNNNIKKASTTTLLPKIEDNKDYLKTYNDYINYFKGSEIKVEINKQKKFKSLDIRIK